ncbi:MAG: HNH endonuclease [Acidobacteria bacterium]|nr:HNH endonuclease [Acidobacteriota bacterium]
MLKEKLDAAQTWKQMEDLVVPRLRLTVNEHAAYSHLIRHSRLEGNRRLHFSITWLGRGTRLSDVPVRKAVRSLAAKGALRIVERSKAGHVVEVLLPGEIAVCRRSAPAQGGFDAEAEDFFRSRKLREAIFRREHNRCFYCFRFLTVRVRALDHVVPKAANGESSYRNVVACCTDCNARKGEKAAEDFLRQLFREGRLNGDEMDERLRAVKELADGKCKPDLAPLNGRHKRGPRPLDPSRHAGTREARDLC